MPGSEPTVTAEQAKVQVDRHLHDAAATVFPGTTLKIQSAMSVSDCTEPEDGGPLGRVTTGVAYEIVGFPPDRNPDAFDTAKRYWTEHGYRVLTDGRPGRAFLRVEAPDPDFTTVTLKESVDGTRVLFLVGDSRCVWPNGTPAPRPGP